MSSPLRAGWLGSAGLCRYSLALRVSSVSIVMFGEVFIYLNVLGVCLGRLWDICLLAMALFVFPMVPHLAVLYRIPRIMYYRHNLIGPLGGFFRGYGCHSYTGHDAYNLDTLNVGTCPPIAIPCFKENIWPWLMVSK